MTSNLPFEDWTTVLGSERLTGALLDRLTHHVSILSLNGDSYRLKSSRSRRSRARERAEQNQAHTASEFPANRPHSFFLVPPCRTCRRLGGLPSP